MYEGFDPERNVKRHGGPFTGLAVFALTMLLLLAVAAPVQAAMGATWGVIATEFMLAALALGVAALLRFDLRETFPLHMPAKRHVGATVLVWLGFVGLALAATLAAAYFFPQQVFGIGEQLSDAFTSTPLALALVTTALLPAVCEELLCRGLIQHTFRRVRVRWLVIVTVAVMFGVMHLSVYRFLPTAILGLALAYLREKSGGLALPMLLHFINNSFSLIVGRLGSSGITPPAGVEAVDLTASVPMTFFFCAMGAPMLIYAGSALFEPMRPIGVKHKPTRAQRIKLIIALVLTALFAAGFFITAAQLANSVADGGALM